MSTTFDLTQFTTLLSQLGEAADSPDFRNGIGEADRVEALKAAQKLALSLEKKPDTFV